MRYNHKPPLTTTTPLVLKYKVFQRFTFLTMHFFYNILATNMNVTCSKISFKNESNNKSSMYTSSV